MRRFLYDSNVFLYALGDPHGYREPCREIVRRAEIGELEGEASTDLVQEVVHHRFRRTRDRQIAALTGAQVAGLCRLHKLAPADLPRALELYGLHPRLSARDAFFAAVALGRGIDAILSADRGFVGVAGLERIDPADENAVDGLARA